MTLFAIGIAAIIFWFQLFLNLLMILVGSLQRSKIQIHWASKGQRHDSFNYIEGAIVFFHRCCRGWADFFYPCGTAQRPVLQQ